MFYNSEEDDDQHELNAILAQHVDNPGTANKIGVEPLRTRLALANTTKENDAPSNGYYCQWMIKNGNDYYPATKTVSSIKPGAYRIEQDSNGSIYFSKFSVSIDGFLRFPQANSERIIKEVEKFWTQKEQFERFGLPYKRGALLYGPPGTGKTSVIRFISKDVIERGGIVISFASPGYFSIGIEKLRDIHPDMPVVTIMEDIDSTIKAYGESEVLNILDGVRDMQNIYFIATTNYPELLGHRIINRPSRFDKVVKIGLPDAVSRKMYFEYLLKNKEIHEVNIDKWVADTEGFSLSHLKELFVSVVVIGDGYEESRNKLKGMSKPLSSTNSNKKAGILGGNDSEEQW